MKFDNMGDSPFDFYMNIFLSTRETKNVYYDQSNKVTRILKQ